MFFCLETQPVLHRIFVDQFKPD